MIFYVLLMVLVEEGAYSEWGKGVTLMGLHGLSCR